MDAPVDLALEQAGGLQNAQVFRDGRQGNAERLGKLGDHGLTLCEAGQNGATGGIGQRAERGVQSRDGIVNHSV